MTTRNADTRPIDPSFHHVSHRELLETVPVGVVPEASVDALVVPTSRPVEWLDDALTLAGGLGCGVVAMCSGAVKAIEVVERGDLAGVPVIAVDVSESDHEIPSFMTAELVADPFFMRPSDTSKKRNLALLLARVAGWERVFLLDDDIYNLQPAHVRTAVGLLSRFDVVGMHNTGFPDNSVVCHIYRDFRKDQSQFIGAGALAVAPLTNRSFFPNIYNQDWFFILGCGQPTNIAVTGEMRQREYDPYVDADRARREELGDCLAEGLYWLLDHRLPIETADQDHWRDFLGRREYLVDDLIDQVIKLDGDRMVRRRLLTALQIARATRELITPGFCAEYLGRWRTDLVTWRTFIDRLPAGLGVEQALAWLAWPGVFTSALPWPIRGVDGAIDEDRLTCESGCETPAAGSELTGAAGRLRDSSQHPSTVASNGAAT